MFFAHVSSREPGAVNCDNMEANDEREAQTTLIMLHTYVHKPFTERPKGQQYMSFVQCTHDHMWQFMTLVLSNGHQEAEPFFNEHGNN